MRKQKLVSYGQIFAEYSHSKNTVNNIPSNTSNTCNDMNDQNTNIKNIQAKSNPIPIFNKNELYKILVDSVTDQEILCIIAKYMFEKALPRLNLKVCHYMVLERIRQRELSSWCAVKETSAKNTSKTLRSDYDYCHVCQRKSMVYGTFCMLYLKYHEHIPLCINCGSKIERRGKRIFEIQGDLIYGKLIKNFVLIKYFVQEHMQGEVVCLPEDILRIIMWNVYEAYEGKNDKNNTIVFVKLVNAWNYSLI